jgi:hypothetical protein
MEETMGAGTSVFVLVAFGGFVQIDRAWLNSSGMFVAMQQNLQPIWMRLVNLCEKNHALDGF